MQREDHAAVFVDESGYEVGVATLCDEFWGDLGTAAQVVERNALVRRRDRHAWRLLTTAAATGGATAAHATGELFLDHLEWQELVTLHVQHLTQLVDVPLGVDAVAALGTVRLNQTLLFQEAQLRDRDVREFRAQHVTDLADAVLRGLGTHIWLYPP